MQLITPIWGSFAVDNPDLGLGSDDTLSANSAVFAADPECQPFFWRYITSNESERKNTTFGKLMPQTDIDILSPFCLVSGIGAGTFPENRITETPLYLLNLTMPVDTWCPAKRKPDLDQYKDMHLFTSLAFDWPNGTTTAAALLCRPQYSHSSIGQDKLRERGRRRYSGSGRHCRHYGSRAVALLFDDADIPIHPPL